MGFIILYKPFEATIILKYSLLFCFVDHFFWLMQRRNSDLDLNLLLGFFFLVSIYVLNRLWFYVCWFVLNFDWFGSDFTVLGRICLFDAWENLIFLSNSSLNWGLLSFYGLNYLFLNFYWLDLLLVQRCILIPCRTDLIFRNIFQFYFLVDVLGYIGFRRVVGMRLHYP